MESLKGYKRITMSTSVFEGNRKTGVFVFILAIGLILIWWGAYDLGKLFDGFWICNAIWVIGNIFWWVFSSMNAYDIMIDSENLSYKKINETEWNKVEFADVSKVKFLVIGRYTTLVVHSRAKEVRISLNSTSNVADLRSELQRKLGNKYDDGTLLESMSRFIPS
jgi:hypothetical protein